MGKRRIQITLDAYEADLLEKYARAKTHKTIGSFALAAMEQAMKRSKVADLHERLERYRMGETGNDGSQVPD